MNVMRYIDGVTTNQSLGPRGRYYDYLTHYSNVIMIADPSQGALGYSDPNVFGADE